MTVVFYLKCDERDSRSVSDIISFENIVRIPTTSLHIGELKSYATYAMAVSAETLAGSGPRSASLNASTLESGPLIFMDDYHPSVVFDTLLHPK